MVTGAASNMSKKRTISPSDESSAEKRSCHTPPAAALNNPRENHYVYEEQDEVSEQIVTTTDMDLDVVLSPTTSFTISSEESSSEVEEGPPGAGLDTKWGEREHKLVARHILQNKTGSITGLVTQPFEDLLRKLGYKHSTYTSVIKKRLRMRVTAHIYRKVAAMRKTGAIVSAAGESGPLRFAEWTSCWMQKGWNGEITKSKCKVIPGHAEEIEPKKRLYNDSGGVKSDLNKANENKDEIWSFDLGEKPGLEFSSRHPRKKTKTLRDVPAQLLMPENAYELAQLDGSQYKLPKITRDAPVALGTKSPEPEGSRPTGYSTAFDYKLPGSTPAPSPLSYASLWTPPFANPYFPGYSVSFSVIPGNQVAQQYIDTARQATQGPIDGPVDVEILADGVEELQIESSSGFVRAPAGLSISIAAEPTILEEEEAVDLEEARNRVISTATNRTGVTIETQPETSSEEVEDEGEDLGSEDESTSSSDDEDDDDEDDDEDDEDKDKENKQRSDEISDSDIDMQDSPDNAAQSFCIPKTRPAYIIPSTTAASSRNPSSSFIPDAPKATPKSQISRTTAISGRNSSASSHSGNLQTVLQSQVANRKKTQMPVLPTQRRAVRVKEIDGLSREESQITETLAQKTKTPSPVPTRIGKQVIENKIRQTSQVKAVKKQMPMPVPMAAQMPVVKKRKAVSAE